MVRQTPDPEKKNGLEYRNAAPLMPLAWDGPADAVAYGAAEIQAGLSDLRQTYFAVGDGGRVGLARGGRLVPAGPGEKGHIDCLACISPARPEHLGDPSFAAAYGVKYPLYTGSMANAIASEEMVIALGKERILSSFGAAGLTPTRLEAAIDRVQQALPEGPYVFCLIHSPNEPALEERTVELYLQRGVRTVEASAFLDLTRHIVAYRAAGLRRDEQGQVRAGNRVIAKVSRREVAAKFMRPAPERLLRELVERGRIGAESAELAAEIPVADDLTVEADSGGHTDNRPLVCLLPSILALRDEMASQTGQRVRVGVGGGIGTPAAVLGAFVMGAAYVVTGSINQACVEAGTSPHIKRVLGEADMADVIMAPAADMFEMGVGLQVLKRGTLFPMRAQKLYELYKAHQSIEEIPAVEREKLERLVFRQSLDAVWEKTVQFFAQRDPVQISRAQDNPKRKMALVFRWYLGLSSHWANAGEEGREMDYQIWCGPAMGAFNDWTRGTYLAEPENRRVVDVNRQLIQGALYLQRLQNLQSQGVYFPPSFAGIKPICRPGIEP